MHITAIVLAAGKGLRFGIGKQKPLAEINSQPVIIYCLQALSVLSEIRDIIVVANPTNRNALINRISKYGLFKIKGVVLGDRRRQDSVRNGLKAIDNNTDLVLIHDGARPFIDRKSLSLLIKEAKRSGSAILGVPVKATIKKVVSYQLPVVSKFRVKETIDRNDLWEIQTPQIFKKDLILEAYRKFGNIPATDDSMLVEKLGVKVSVVLGSYHNIKITKPEDIVIAEAIQKSLRRKRNDL